MGLRLLSLALLAACGGVYGGRPRAVDTAGAGRGLDAAALPFSVLDARTGRQVDAAAFWDRVGGSRVVCVGEEHPNPHHHWFQLHVVRQIAGRGPARTPLALGMEMFQRPYQGVLDDYAASKIDTAALLSRSGYEERWGYDYGFYGPTIDAARAAGGALLALNAPRELTKKIVRSGLDALTSDEQRQLPELVLDDAQHRAWFDATMEEVGGAHGGGAPASAMPDDDVHRAAAAGTGGGTAAPDDDVHRSAAAGAGGGTAAPDDDVHRSAAAARGAAALAPSPDRIYTAQVLWDESMADGAARWAAAQPGGRLVLLAGNGHCHDSAIVNRVKRRGVDRVISIQPVVDVEGQVARALARPVNDFIVVLELPPSARGK